MTVKAECAEKSSINNVCNSFNKITSKPVNFLSVQENLVNPVSSVIKDIYDLSKTFDDPSIKNPALKKLIIKNLDEEQIWQLLELENNAKTREFINKTSVILSAGNKLKSITFPFKFQEEEQEEGREIEEDEEQEEEEVEEEEEDCNDMVEDDFKDENGSEAEAASEDGIDDDLELKSLKKKSKHVPSVVDDKFFKLNELETYLELEDKKESIGQHNDEDELIDYFDKGSDTEASEDQEENEENQGIKFKDFFRAPDEDLVIKKKKVSRSEMLNNLIDDDDDDVEEDDDDDDDDDGEEQMQSEEEEEEEESDDQRKEPKSSFELRQERIKSKIENLEDDLLAEKSWQLKGEIAGSKRPQNSLLEEFVEFDLTSRPAPVITEKTTLRLEDIIRQRIKDKAFDDVERKIKPVELPQEFKKKLVLDQEKSKLSLAQIYEQEFLKQADASIANPLEEKPEEVPKEHTEIKNMMDHLFRQLDALANFHYTPNMVQPEIRIVTNTPAIEVEEVAPVTTTDATLLAPEEVKRKPLGDVMSKEERTDADKKRERRKKKIKQKIKHKKQEEKAGALLKAGGLGKKFSKDKMKKTLEAVTKSRNVTQVSDEGHSKTVKSSTAFFNQLQDEVKATIKRKTTGQDKGRNNSMKDVKKIKL